MTIAQQNTEPFKAMMVANDFALISQILSTLKDTSQIIMSFDGIKLEVAIYNGELMLLQNFDAPANKKKSFAIDLLYGNTKQEFLSLYKAIAKGIIKDDGSPDDGQNNNRKYQDIIIQDAHQTSNECITFQAVSQQEQNDLFDKSKEQFYSMLFNFRTRLSQDYRKIFPTQEQIEASPLLTKNFDIDAYYPLRSSFDDTIKKIKLFNEAERFTRHIARSELSALKITHFEYNCKIPVFIFSLLSKRFTDDNKYDIAPQYETCENITSILQDEVIEKNIKIDDNVDDNGEKICSINKAVDNFTKVVDDLNKTGITGVWNA